MAVEFQPTTTDHFSYMGGGEAFALTTAPRFVRGMSQQNDWFNSDTLLNRTKDVVPFAATLTDFYVALSVAPGVGKSWDFIMVLNGSEIAASALNISGTNTSGNVTGMSQAIAAGDVLTFKAKAANSTPASTRVGRSITLVPSTAGLFALNSVSADTSLGASNLFMAQAAYASTAINATEANVQINKSPALLQLVALYVLTVTAAGAGKTRTFQQRVNTANGNIVATISGVTDVAGNDTGHVDQLAAGDVFNLAYSATASTSSTTAHAWAVAAKTVASGGGNAAGSGRLVPDSQFIIGRLIA
jgi:hypothetical protein